MSNSVVVKAPGFFQILTLVFIVLKLTNCIDWSWWWVLAPLWIPLAITVVIVFVIAVLAGIGCR